MNQLIVTNNTITFNHQVIKTSNISSIDLKESIAKNMVWLIILGVLLGLSAVGRLGQLLENPVSGLVSLILGGLSFLCFWYNNKQKKDNQNYFLMIQTNAGPQQLFSNKDYNFINGIRLKIQESLDSSGHAFNLTYNLDNKTVINNPTGNITITNVTHYQGLSEDDKNFIKYSFEPALQRIQDEVSKNANEEFKRNFDMLRQELKSSKPRKPILEAAWTVFSNVGSLSDIASVIEKGINMF